jgi:hypothetical protein
VSIFVSIAAYRDPELAPTLRSCIGRALYPNDLRFGLCWQHGEEEAALAEFADPRIRVFDVHWRQSRGVCWARAEIMKLWNHEDFFLQIDSHHRFAQDWDAKLLAQAERSAAGKPILSAYPDRFDPRLELPAQGEAMQNVFQSFNEDGVPVVQPCPIPPREDCRKPVRARFVAAGFLFAPGSFVTDVSYDPDLYFMGEEITLAIRAFTRGYDLFHPAEHILWHEYTRTDRPKHWGDHVHAQGVDLEWHARDAQSRAKVRQFLAEPHIGAFGCGASRTFAEYEAYAGLSFAHRTAQDSTLQGLEPPIPPWPGETPTWRARVRLERAELPPAALDAPRLWYVGFHDSRDVEICREDASGDELRRLLAGNGPEIVIEREFRSARHPATWTVWPMDADGAWLGRIVGAPELGG